MKKILVVGSIGGLLLWLFVRLCERPAPQGGGGAVDIAMTTSPVTLASAAAPIASGSALPPSPSVPMGPPGAPPTPSDAATCVRLVDLCSTSDQKMDEAECELDIAKSRKLSGSGNVERSVACVAEAKTCAAATGCMSGGIGMGAMGEFLKGLGSAISR